jgi:cell division FtsZ-interacting protein ZapD
MHICITHAKIYPCDRFIIYLYIIRIKILIINGKIKHEEETMYKWLALSVTSRMTKINKKTHDKVQPSRSAIKLKVHMLESIRENNNN